MYVLVSSRLVLLVVVCCWLRGVCHPSSCVELHRFPFSSVGGVPSG